MVCYFALSILVLVSQTVAVPDEFKEYADTLHHYLSRQKRQAEGGGSTFDAASQCIPTTGPNAFVPPGKTDQRGPCPGLNVLANHNYLPHNGVATTAQYIFAVNKVFGMGYDLAAFLSVYGAFISGDGSSWSMGGPSSQVTPSSLLRKAWGLSFSHNEYEGDGSISRSDMFLSANKSDAATLQLRLFTAFLATKNGTDADYNFSTFIDWSAKRLDDCKRLNRYCVYDIIAGLLVVRGAYHFTDQMMANHSAEFANGKLTREVLKSFFAVSGDGDKLTYKRGHERIPDNWCKRPVTNQYTIPLLQFDLIRAAFKYPQFAIPGCNNGTVNSFNAFNIESLTGGAYSLRTLFQGNNLICFFLRVFEQRVPLIYRGAFRAISYLILSFYGSVIGSTTPIVCPDIQYNSSDLMKCPGITRLNENGTYSGEA